MVCKTLEEFEKRWENIAKKVEDKTLDREQAKSIANSFLDEILIFNDNQVNRDKKVLNFDLFQAMTEISNSLNVSLQIAISNHEKLTKRGWLHKLFENSNFNLDVNGIKNQLGK